MKIKVTQKDIDRGVKNDCDSCPIALAMSKAFGHMISVNDHEYRSRISFTYYPLPVDVQNFIGHFDCEDQVEPFEFEV